MEKAVTGIAARPIQAIEVVVALTLLVFGLYIMSPFYVITTTAAIAESFGQEQALRSAVGFIFYIIPSSPTVLSLFFPRFDTPKWHAKANLGMFIGVMFLTLLRLLTVGLFPFTWLFSLGLGLVAAVCYLYWKAK